MTKGDSQDRGGLDKRWTVVIVTVVVALAAVAITAIITFGSNPAKTTSASTTTTHFPAATSTTTIPQSPSTISTQATTTSLPPSTTASHSITYGSPNGMVVWQSGDPIPAVGGNAYEGYYCCNEPFPDGVNRSGSAGCSGQGTAPDIAGGYYANGQLC
jgi:hypothetical protein